MAIDLSAKALDVAQIGVDNADKFLDAVEALEKILEVSLDSGIDMTDYDTELADSSLKHIDGTMFNRIAIAVPNVLTAINEAGSAGGGGVTIRQLFNQLRG